MDHERRFPMAGVEWSTLRSGDALEAARAQVAVLGVGLRAVVLVEGISDQVAVEALAERRGQSLHRDGVAVVPIGGATSIGAFLGLFGPQGLDVMLAGLCDAAEERSFQRGLERAGLGRQLTRDTMEYLGFFVCTADLEDEMIRSLGTAAVEQVLATNGDLGSFRIFAKQPAQRERTDAERQKRFFGTRSGRKIRYARLLVEALDLAQVPVPLDRLLAHVGRWAESTPSRIIMFDAGVSTFGLTPGQIC